MTAPVFHRTRIKLCGLVRPQDVDTAVALGADAIGLVLWPRSPRALDLDAARALRRRLPSWVAAVGLFVNEPAEGVARAAAAVGLDALQLHGDESPQDCQRVAAASGLPWWRAIRMKGEGDLLESAARFPDAECLLLDAWSEGYGGSGKRFDWRWARHPVDAPARRIVLSGGLAADSVGEAIRQVAPFAVDVSSGVQGAHPREKDAASMERFVAAVAAADTQRTRAPHA